MGLYKKVRITSHQRKLKIKHSKKAKAGSVQARPRRKAKRIQITPSTVSATMIQSPKKPSTKILVPRKKKKIPSEELKAIEEARNLGYRLGQAGYGRK